MTSSNNLYVYNRTFNDAGTYQATVECSKVNETTKTQSLSFSILAGVSKPPSVNLKSPVNSFVSINNSLAFECFASDTENITRVDLFTNIDQTWKLQESKPESYGKNATVKFSVSNIKNGPYLWNCRAANDKGASGFASANFSFTINSPSTQNCTIGDWSCPSDWTPSDATCVPGSQQARTCTRPTTCLNPDTVKPEETRACANVACTPASYQCQEWSTCSDKGNQTRTCRQKASATCFGDTIKTETQSCAPPGNPWLLIIIVIVVVLAVVGGLFFYFHKKATKEPEDETLWDTGTEGGEPSYEEGEYPPEGGEEEK